MPATLTFKDDALVTIAAESAPGSNTPGAFSPVLYLLTTDVDRSAGDITRTFFIGMPDDDAHVSSGDPDDTYDFTGAKAYGDATGQDVVVSGYDTRAPRWVRVLPDGVNGEQQRVIITGHGYGIDRNAGEDFNSARFAATGAGAVTKVTGV